VTTRVFGYSDDNVCAEGDFSDEWGCWNTDLVLTCSDGTELHTHYGKEINGVTDGIWSISVIMKGALFDRLEECFDADADPYSDIVYFRDGLTAIEITVHVGEGVAT
jgi:hypothetical protein